MSSRENSFYVAFFKRKYVPMLTYETHNTKPPKNLSAALNKGFIEPTVVAK